MLSDILYKALHKARVTVRRGQGDDLKVMASYSEIFHLTGVIIPKGGM